LSGAAVEILRDELGVAHVRARASADAFFGQGFACAQDRLWQMELDRRRAAGRWAEVVGEVAVARDAFLRRTGLARAARRDLEALGADARAMLEAYARGVNAFLCSGAALPLEFALTGLRPEPWEPWHSLAVYKLRHLFMGPFQRKLWRAALLREHGEELVAALRADDEDGETLSVPPGAAYREALDAALDLAPAAAALDALADADGASNHWALHGSRTASGKPLLAGDPHRALDLPNTYWQCHLACERFDAVGLAFAGVPGLPHFGHNASVAWSITHGMADDQDLFVERDVAAMPRRRERIGVRGAEAVEIEAVDAPHGPIVLGGPPLSAGIALAWPTLVAPDPTFDAILPMLEARDCAALDAAQRDWVVPCNNLIAADVHGAIHYRFRGRVPVRDAANRWTPVPGWDARHDWRGFVPFEALPSATRPEGGVLAAANNRPAGAGTPYLGVDFCGPSRVRRILARLAPLERATAEDMRAIHGDDVSLVAPRFVRALDGAAPGHAHAAFALERLRAWDFRMAPDSVAAALYASFREQLALLVGEALGLASASLGKLGEPAPPPERMTLLWNALPGLLAARFSPPGRAAPFDWREACARAFERALAFLEARLGPDPDEWRWARLHRTLAWHPLAVDLPEARRVLAPPTVPMGGDGDTVLCGGVVPGFGLRASLVSVARYVFDLSDWEKCGWTVAHGVSGDRASPHHTDQVLAWTELRLHPMRYDWRGIESAARSRLALEPERAP
jgi:penicillin amidase